MKTINRNSVIAVALFLLLWTVQPASAFYTPNAQRWVTRDPIGESGFELAAHHHAKPGIRESNLYTFILNEPINHLDYKGLFIIPYVRVYPDEPPDPAKTHTECWYCFNKCAAYFACFRRRPGDSPQLNPTAFHACMLPINSELTYACQTGNQTLMDRLIRRAKNCFDHHW